MPRGYPRTERLNAQIQRELASLIRNDLKDPRIGGVTVTRVSVSPDLRSAAISVSSFGSDTELSAAVTSLQKAAPRLRHILGKQLHLRYIPSLRFVPDHALREGDRIAGLIRGIALPEGGSLKDGEDVDAM